MKSNIGFKNFALVLFVCGVIASTSILPGCRGSHFENDTLNPADSALFEVKVTSSQYETEGKSTDLQNIQVEAELWTLSDHQLIRNQPVKISIDHPNVLLKENVLISSNNDGKISFRFPLRTQFRELETVYKVVFEVDTKDFGRAAFVGSVQLSHESGPIAEFSVSNDPQLRPSTLERPLRLGVEVLSVTKRKLDDPAPTRIEILYEIETKMRLLNRGSEKRPRSQEVQIRQGDSKFITTRSDTEGIFLFKSKEVIRPFEAEENFIWPISVRLPQAPLSNPSNFTLVLNLENDPEGPFVDVRQVEDSKSEIPASPPNASKPANLSLQSEWSRDRNDTLDFQISLLRIMFKGVLPKAIPATRLIGKAFLFSTGANHDGFEEILIDTVTDDRSRWSFVLPRAKESFSRIAMVLETPEFVRADRAYLNIFLSPLEVQEVTENEMTEQILQTKTPLKNLTVLSPH